MVRSGSRTFNHYYSIVWVGWIWAQNTNYYYTSTVKHYYSIVWVGGSEPRPLPSSCGGGLSPLRPPPPLTTIISILQTYWPQDNTKPNSVLDHFMKVSMRCRNGLFWEQSMNQNSCCGSDTWMMECIFLQNWLAQQLFGFTVQLIFKTARLTLQFNHSQKEIHS